MNKINNKSRLLLRFGGLLLVFLWIPTAVILLFGGEHYEKVYTAKESGRIVVIDDEKNGSSYELDVEEYIVCAMAAQIEPWEEEELLKSFAIIIRTHIYRIMGDGNRVNASEIELPYVSYNNMQVSWKDKFTENYNRLNKVVSDTYMMVLTYEDEVIIPYFHSLSSGATRNGKDVAAVGDLPYLISVNAKDDMVNEKYLSMKTFSYSEFAEKLKTYRDSIIISFDNPLEVVTIVERDVAGYVKNIQVGSTMLTGDEFMECFGLKSPNFTVEDYEGKVRIVTKGNGHGLGLSLNSGKSMASAGKSYKEILLYFYTDIEISKIGEK